MYRFKLKLPNGGEENHYCPSAKKMFLELDKLLQAFDKN